MSEAKTRRRRWAMAALVAAHLIGLGSYQLFVSARPSPSPDMSMYDYRATRRLVALTTRAAALVREMGPEAFRIFRDEPEQWSVDGNSYVYVYEREGVVLFHGGYPQLTGKNLIDFKDQLGRQAGRLIVEQLDDYPDVNPHGWTHYLWSPPGALDGVWKSSCNFRVTMPDGRRVFVGSGFDEPLEERVFYGIIVDEAAALLGRDGAAALPRLRSPQGPFTIHDRGVFVLDSSGTALIDPGLNLETPRNLFEYRDLTGRRPMWELTERLKGAQAGWVIMLNRERAGGKAVKKGIYGRRAAMDGQSVVVGAISPLPEPAWMR